MTEEMIGRFVEEVRRVCVEPGFGEVAVVIEKGRPRRLRRDAGTWLEERTGGPPGRDVGRKITA